MDITISRASENDWPIVSDIAKRSYYTTYVGVLSGEQIEFMLNRSYSHEGIISAMGKGQIFYIANEADECMGFIALQKKNDHVLRIEKLYLVAEAQGKGFGRDLIQFAVEQALLQHCTTLELNVNRKNKAYYFYLKQGFQVVETVDIPYFGFILDDYVMQKTL